jgi:hypothetical protein
MTTDMMDALHAEDVPDQNGELGNMHKRRLVREQERWVLN